MYIGLGYWTNTYMIVRIQRDRLEIKTSCYKSFKHERNQTITQTFLSIFDVFLMLYFLYVNYLKNANNNCGASLDLNSIPINVQLELPYKADGMLLASFKSH